MTQTRRNMVLIGALAAASAEALRRWKRYIKSLIVVLAIALVASLVPAAPAMALTVDDPVFTLELLGPSSILSGDAAVFQLTSSRLLEPAESTIELVIDSQNRRDLTLTDEISANEGDFVQMPMGALQTTFTLEHVRNTRSSAFASVGLVGETHFELVFRAAIEVPPTLTAIAGNVVEGESLLVEFALAGMFPEEILGRLEFQPGSSPSASNDDIDTAGLTQVGQNLFEFSIPAGSRSIIIEIPTVIDRRSEGTENLVLSVTPAPRGDPAPLPPGVVVRSVDPITLEVSISDRDEADRPEPQPRTPRKRPSRVTPPKPPRQAGIVFLISKPVIPDPLVGPIAAGPIEATREGQTVVLSLPLHLRVWLDPNSDVAISHKGATLVRQSGTPGMLVVEFTEKPEAPVELTMRGRLRTGGLYSEVIVLGDAG